MSATITEDKIRQIETAWANLAPGQSFGGLSLDQYRAVVKPSMDAREQIALLTAQLRAEFSRRDGADAASTLIVSRVVNGVRADPAAGDDSALYEAMGYIRRSARRNAARRVRKESVAVAA